MLIMLPVLCVVTLYVSLRDNQFQASMLIEPLVIFVFGSLIISPFLFIKKVTLVPDGFWVTNYRKKILIPFSRVKSIHGSLLIGPELILLRVEECGFGQFIIFIPKLRLSGITINPVVKELRSFLNS